LEGGAGNRRSYIMRGIPTGVVNELGVYLGPAFWLPLLVTFRGVMVGGFGNESPPEIKTSILTVAGQITALTALAGNPRAIQIPNAAVPGAVAGSRVRVSGVTTMAYANGMWRVRVVVGGNLIMFPRQRSVIGTYGGEGFAQVQTVASIPIDDMVALRGRDRDTGRPSDSPRGRRRPVRV